MSMAGSYVGFDPYQQWLGIPPHEQPPHQYRLLGLQLFEPDLQAIALAADRLLGHLGTVSDPAYAPIASRLYEEIVTARGALTDPYRKAQYDAWLQNALAAVPNYGASGNYGTTGYSSAPGYGAATQGYGAAQAGYGAAPSAGSYDPNGNGANGYANGVQGYANTNGAQGYANGVQGYSTGAQGYANGVQGYATGTQPAQQDASYSMPSGMTNSAPMSAPTNPVNPNGYSTGAYYSHGSHHGTAAAPTPEYQQPQYQQPQYQQPQPQQQQYAQPQPTYTAPAPAPTYAAAGYGAAAAYAGTSAPVPMVPQAPVQHPVQPLVSAAPEMATAGWQVGARPTVSSEPEIQGSGPPPYKMLGFGAAALVLIIIVGVLRNMGDDKKPDRKVAQTKSEAPAKTVQPVTPDVSKPAPPPDGSALPEPQPEPEPVPVPVKPEPEPLPVKPEPKKTIPKPEPEPEPIPEPTKPEPKKPEPKPEPEPEPEPKPPEVDPLVLKKANEMLSKVRIALARRDVTLAKQRLHAAKEMKVDSLAQEIARLEMLTSNVEDFWNSVRKSIAGLANVDELEVGKTRVAVVEANGDKLILRIDGLNKTFLVDSMSLKLSMALADRYYKPIASSKIFKGSFHAIDAMGDRKEARALWEAAKREGGAAEKDVVELLMPELNIPLPTDNGKMEL